MVGKSLSHYNIVEELGRGGMGIVYKAEDTKLDRTVAIKVLPVNALANEADRERFYREAKAAAQLHHPHIASVFEIDEAVPSDAPHGTEPSPFIAMEFVDGGTLRAEIEKGPMKLKEAVRIAFQIAEALKLAHSKDIVHRDIKSYNVMLTSDGDAKVLDFGLAKTAQSTMLTRMGSTLGTVAYMSPEQARGDDVDHRSDIWSLGIVLFEMVAGRLPFAGEYEKAVMYGILNEMPPPLTSLRTGVPMGLEWIVSKCLAKDPNERYQACADLIVDLKTVDLSASGLSRQSASGVTGIGAVPAQESRSRKAMPSWVGFLLLPLGLAAGWFLFGGGERPEDGPPPRTYKLVLDETAYFESVVALHDGSKLVGAYGSEGGSALAMLDLRSGEISQFLPHVYSCCLSISLDDQWVAYQDQGSFYKVRTQGGSPVLLMSAGQLFGSVWLPNGDVVLSAFTGPDMLEILKFPADGSEAVQLVATDSTRGQRGHVYPVSLNNRPHILVTMADYIGGVHIGAVHSETGGYTEIGLGSPVAYLASGHLLYLESNNRSGRLLVRPFDADKLEFTGPPLTVEQNADRRRLTVDRFGTYYSQSFLGSGGTDGVEARLYVNGELAKTIGMLPASTGYQPRLSPDGKRAMLRITVENHQELHEFDFERGTVRQFTVESDGDADNSAYSSDGTELVFELNNKLYRRNANGSGQTVEIPTVDGTSSIDWSRSGRWIVHNATNVNGYSKLYRIDMETQESETLDGGDGGHGWPRISPDERFVVYATLGAEGVVVWVLSFEDGNRFRVAQALGGPFTAWSRDGDYLYYQSNGLVRIPVTTDPYFQVMGVPETVLGPEVLEFDLISEGDSIFAIVAPELINNDVSVEYTVITDWMKELRQIAPAVE